MRILIVGLGNVGRTLYEIARERGFEVYGYDIDASRSIDVPESIPRPIDALHIAIPYTKGFVDEVSHYIEEFRPRFTVVHSTVAPGTTRRIHIATGKPVAYSPIRGRHPLLKKHMLFWSKWICAIPTDIVDDIAKHLESMGFKVRIYRGTPESLELAKLWETVYRAIMIASWQEVHRIAKRFNADIKIVAEFVAEVHRVLRDRPVYFPGYIGGHCLIPNTKILNDVYPSKLLEFVLESNALREQELKDPEIYREIEELKKIFLELTDRDYYLDV